MATVSHATQAGIDLHEDKRLKEPVRVASVANVTISGPGSTLDGVTLANGDRLLLKDQSTPSQNGIYVFNGAASTATRSTDADAAADFVFGFLVYVREGTVNGPSYWAFSQSSSVTLGSTAITFVKIFVGAALADPTTTRGDLISRGASAIGRLALGAASTVLSSNGTDPAWTAAPTVTGESTAQDFKATGLTGATSGARLVGATTSGAPVSGTFAVGDLIVDQTGKLWVCTGAGTPGSWVQTSGTMTNPMTTNQDLIVGGTSPAAGSPARLAVGANSQVLTVTGGVVGWANSASGFGNPMTSPGDLISATAGGSPVRVPVGANGQVLAVIGGLVGWTNPAGGAGGTNNTVAASLFLARNYI